MNRKWLKGKKALELSRSKKKRENIYVVNLAFLGVRPDTALCTLVGASSPPPGISF